MEHLEGIPGPCNKDCTGRCCGELCCFDKDYPLSSTEGAGIFHTWRLAIQVLLWVVVYVFFWGCTQICCYYNKRIAEECATSTAPTSGVNGQRSDSDTAVGATWLPPTYDQVLDNPELYPITGKTEVTAQSNSAIIRETSKDVCELNVVDLMTSHSFRNPSGEPPPYYCLPETPGATPEIDSSPTALSSGLTAEIERSSRRLSRPLAFDV